MSFFQEGIACTFSNFSNETVTLDGNSQMAWLEVLPTSTPTDVMFTEVSLNNNFENCEKLSEKKSCFLRSTVIGILNFNTKLLIFVLLFCNFLLVISPNENSYNPQLNHHIFEGTSKNICNYSMKNKTNVNFLPDIWSLSHISGYLRNLGETLDENNITHFELYSIADETLVFYFYKAGDGESFSYFIVKNVKQIGFKIPNITQLYIIQYKNTPFGKISKMKKQHRIVSL